MSDPPNTDPPPEDDRARQHRTPEPESERREPGEVRAFFALLGNLLRREPKPVERPLERLVAEVVAPEAEQPGDASAWPAAAAGRRAPTLRRETALLVAFFAVAAGAVLYRELQPRIVTTLPSKLVGIWRTDAPKYADRSLEITTSHLGFQGGAGVVPAPLHPIVRVRQTARPEGVVFRVEYLQDDTRAELDFVWQDSWQGSPRPKIRFSNQTDLVWTREEPAGPTAPPGRPAR